jgi:hypothetical protein
MYTQATQYCEHTITALLHSSVARNMPSSSWVCEHRRNIVQINILLSGIKEKQNKEEAPVKKEPDTRFLALRRKFSDTPHCRRRLFNPTAMRARNLSFFYWTAVRCLSKLWTTSRENSWFIKSHRIIQDVSEVRGHILDTCSVGQTIKKPPPQKKRHRALCFRCLDTLHIRIWEWQYHG